MPTSTKPAEGDFAAGLVRAGLAVVALFSLVLAAVDAFGKSLGDKTPALLVIAVVALVIDRITKFKGFGVEFERQVQELKEEVEGMGEAVGVLEKNVGPGSKNSSGPPAAVPAMQKSSAAPVVADDPNKGQFGGSPRANGRELSATIRPIAGAKSSLCKVKICVKSLDPTRPLTGHVRFHLHPSFGMWSSYDVNVNPKGVAEDEIESFGAFTIGVEADNHQSKLELDLMTVKGGTERFYQE